MSAERNKGQIYIYIQYNVVRVNRNEIKYTFIYSIMLSESKEPLKNVKGHFDLNCVF